MKGETHTPFGAKEIHNDNSCKNKTHSYTHTHIDLNMCSFQIHWDAGALRNPLLKTI